MLSFELLKWAHISFVFVFLSFAILVFLSNQGRLSGAIMYIGAVGVMFFGMGAIGVLRMGMPGWVWAKFGIWALMMALLGVINKRFPKYRPHGAGLILVLASLATYLAIYKPDF